MFSRRRLENCKSWITVTSQLKKICVVKKIANHSKVLQAIMINDTVTFSCIFIRGTIEGNSRSSYNTRVIDSTGIILIKILKSSAIKAHHTYTKCLLLDLSRVSIYIHGYLPNCTAWGKVVQDGRKERSNCNYGNMVECPFNWPRFDW